ncbi:hypothetical protein ABTZ99_40320 [Actinosynnema sp. NPDC002837]
MPNTGEASSSHHRGGLAAQGGPRGGVQDVVLDTFGKHRALDRYDEVLADPFRGLGGACHVADTLDRAAPTRTAVRTTTGARGPLSRGAQ